MAYRINGKTESLLGDMWQEACEKGKSLSFKVVSGSMRPTIKVGDVVKVTRAQPAEVRIGDVVAFNDGPHVIVHRIIGKRLSNHQIIFRHIGDAGLSSGYVDGQNLIGRVSQIERGGRVVESQRHLVTGRMIAWQLQLVESLVGNVYRHFGTNLRYILRPAWRLYRNLPFRRL